MANLPVLPEGYSYFPEGEDILIKEVDDEETFVRWMKNLGDISFVTWRVSRSYPKASEHSRSPYMFQKLYRCQHFTRLKHKATKMSKNTDCPAQLMVKIRKKKDGTEIWPCSLQFRYEHNHALSVPSALRYRPVSEEAKAEIAALFRRGHTLATAYATYVTNKMAELGSDYYRLSCDRSLFPTKCDVNHMWQKEFKLQFGERSGANMIKDLKEMLVLLDNQGHHTHFGEVNNKYVISIATPLMIRAHSLNSLTEILFVDASANCDIQNHRIYFLATYCGGVGGVPLGCIVTDSLKSDAFDLGLKAFLHHFRGCFEKHPSVIMTDDDQKEREVLSKYFPESKLLLCTFHVLKACWKWLLSKDHGIPAQERQGLYLKFKDLVYAVDLSEFQRKETQLQVAIVNYLQLQAYLTKVLCKQKAWAHCYRKDLLTRGHDTNNAVEVMFRIFKDIPLERTKAFNLIQLIDFVTTAFENYYIQRLLDTVNGRVDGGLLKRVYPNSHKNLDGVVKISETMFSVQSDSSSDIYNIDMSIGVCSCFVGKQGKVCKHQVAVIEKFNLWKALNTLSQATKQDLYYIASGTKAPLDYFQPLVSNLAPVTMNDARTPDLLPNDDTQNSPLESPTETQALLTSAREKLQYMFSRLEEELVNDPSNMVPAVNKLFEKFNCADETSSKLISALHSLNCTQTFQRSKPNISTSKKLVARAIRRGPKIPVQPTAIGRRRTKYTGKRKMVCGKPSGIKRVIPDHDYTGIGCMPTKKIKRPHSLSECVERNVSLGQCSKQK